MEYLNFEPFPNRKLMVKKRKRRCASNNYVRSCLVFLFFDEFYPAHAQ